MFQNPIKMALQKYMLDLLKEKCYNHSQVIERMSHYLVTEQDLKQFGALVADIYQSAYSKANQDFMKKLSEQGYSFSE